MPQWLRKAVFYEIYPQSFYDANGDGIGDIPGIIKKLSYIRGLGCNAIWLNPCFVSPFMDAGYDVADYRRVAPRYGTNEDLYTLFEKAHEAGMHILLDLVPGHTSEQHEWFKQSALPTKNSYTNRYIWTDSVWKMPKDQMAISGRHDRDGNYIVNFFSVQPALNYGYSRITEDWQLPCTHPDCIATREALKDIMRFWLDHGCDGFRVDMAETLVKNDDDRSATSKIWQNIREMLDHGYPEAVLVSEWSYPQRALKCGFHSDFYLDHADSGYHSLFRDKDRKTGKQTSFFSKQGKGDITRFTEDYLKKYNGSKDYGYISFITCNHDTPRMSRDFDTTELKLSYAFIFTMPGVPFLYYGDEIGMKYQEGLPSKEGGYDRTGTRTPMQWTGDHALGFSTAPDDKLYLPVDTSKDAPTVERQEQDKQSLLNLVKSVITLRNENPDLQADGPFEIIYAEKNKYPFIYRRGKFTFAVNPSQNTVSVPLHADGSVVLAVGAPAQLHGDEITVYPQSFTAFS